MTAGRRDSETARASDEARRAYRARLAELRVDVEDGEASGDAERVGRLSEEIDFITRELARGMGLGGRTRQAGSIAERARLNVTRALRTSLRHIAAANPRLAAHLEVALRTGMVCEHSPDPRAPIGWRVSSPSVHSS
jgi:hypothetical protein